MNLGILCNNLICCQINKNNYSLSWDIDTNKIKSYLKENYNIEKIYDFQEKIDYIIEVDNLPSFDSINKKLYQFTNINHDIGKITQSCIINFIPQLEKTYFYVRVKIISGNYNCIVKLNNQQQTISINIDNDFSESLSIIVDKNYTLDIIKTMYNGIPDSNAYSKGAYDANFYYILQCFAIQDNTLFNNLNLIKNNFFVNKCSPSNLDEIFGGMLDYNRPIDIVEEEYRRIIIELFKSLQKAGTEDSILNVVKYLIGESAEIIYFNKIYPWILRSINYQKNYNDPNLVIDPVNSSYINNASNYYLYNEKLINQANRKNRIILLNKNFKLFNFEIINDNFFNNNINIDAIKKIVNKLKPVYTKYILNITPMEEIEDE